MAKYSLKNRKKLFQSSILNSNGIIKKIFNALISKNKRLNKKKWFF